jgi:hypothetical protein
LICQSEYAHLRPLWFPFEANSFQARYSFGFKLAFVLIGALSAQRLQLGRCLSCPTKRIAGAGRRQTMKKTILTAIMVLAFVGTGEI